MEKTGTPSAFAMERYSPISVTPQFVFNPGQNYGNFFLPGVLAALLQQVVVIGAALTWVREFRSGEIRDLLEITRNPFTLAAGKLLVYVLIGAVWAVFFFAGLFPVFGIPFTGSRIAGSLLIVLMLAGMGLLAMTISSFVEHRETAMQVMFIVSSPAFLLSGYTFPQFAMTGVARWAGYVIPLTPFLTGWRRVVLYGGGCADILPELAMLACGIVCFAGIMLFSVSRKINVVAQ
jgi:ABC-2 type transport system permease protein